MTSQAAEILRKKLDFLETSRAANADPAQQFQLDVQIQTAKDELLALEAPQAVRPPAGPPPPPRLPPRPARCFGRTVEVETLVAALCGDPPSPTPLLGGPGMGKSTISLEGLHDPRARERFGARRYFVRCETATNAAALVQELARGLGLDLQAGGSLTDRAFAELERGPVALVLDNLETPWWADRELVEELLAQLAGLSGVALADSLRGSKRPGRVAWGTTVGVEVLPPEAARRAFLAIAGEPLAADPNLDGLLEAVERIALAVELLAYQAEGHPDLASLRRRWVDEKARLLEVGAGRLSSLSVSLELSIASPRATPAARRLLALLGALPDGMAVDDLPALLEGGDASADCLRQVGLVAGRDPRRLQLLAPVREHVNARHPAEPTDLHRAGAFYVDLAQLGERVGAVGGAEAVARLTAELNNLEVAVRRALAGEGPGPAIDAARSLARLYRFTGLGHAALLETARDVARSAADVQREARCLKSLGDIAFYRSDHAEARTHFEAALPLFQSAGDVRGEAGCIEWLGDIALVRSEHAEARERYEAARPLYRRVEDVLGEANCIKGLGDIAYYGSNHAEARAHYEAARPLFRRSEDALGEANCIYSLGDIALALSEHAEARERYEAARPLYQRVGALLGEANCIQRLGDIAVACREDDEALERYEAALPLFRRVGSVLGEANCFQGLGDIAFAREEQAEARERYEAALSLYQPIGSLLGRANCLLRLGDLEREKDPARARQLVEEALGLCRRIEDPYSTARAHVASARLAETDEERRSHVQAARELCERMARPGLIDWLRGQFGEDLDTTAQSLRA